MGIGRTHREADVAIVGGGLAGLMAARTIARAGWRPLVLEARDRLGGRVVDASLGDDQVVELGGQWVSPRDQRMRALLDELGIELFPTYDRGRHLIELGREARRYRGNVPRLSPVALLDLARARWRLERHARSVPVATPWIAPRAEEWDRETLCSWMDGHVRSRDARALLDVAITTVWAQDPHGVNLLSALALIQQAGSFTALGATRGGLLQDRVAGGPASIVRALSSTVSEHVVCGCPVTSIVDRGTSVEVESAGVTVTALRAIVATPLLLAADIRCEPALPRDRREALASVPLGAVVKSVAVYERPFWRERGFSGRAITVDRTLTSTFDTSAPDGPGVLTGFTPGRRASRLAALPAAERRSAVLESFARLYGPEAANPVEYLEKDWTADPWSRGCYFGLPATGSLTRVVRAVATPVGSIHWAGTETQFESFGSMDGAVRSGERAATEALAALEGAPVAAIAAT